MGAMSSLPERHPKPAADDPDAPGRVRALMENPSYVEAERDAAFLEGGDTRGVRLQLDYLKTELALEREGIRHTIVVFGSTRIPEPAAAARALAERRAELAAAPEDPERARRVAVAERIHAKSRYYDVARELGRLVGSAPQAADGGRIAVLTGGGPGLMEAANRGAFDAGAESIGLNISLPFEQFPNPYISPSLCFKLHYFAIRKLHFLLRARALVAFPGGFGTCDELFEMLTLVQTRRISPLPVVLVGEAYWRRLFDADFMVEEGVITPEDRALFSYAESATDIWQGIERWYWNAGRPLV